MDTRRQFLQHSAIGLLSGMLTTYANPALAGRTPPKGFVKQPTEGETYFVRENTPITIIISKKIDNVGSHSLCTEVLTPGGLIPTHKHLRADEFFYFNAGSGIFMIDDEEFTITEGSAAFVPMGAWHSVKNTGDRPMMLTFGFSPAGFEDFFRQIGTPKGTPFKAKTPEEARRIADMHGMVFRQQ